MGGAKQAMMEHEENLAFAAGYLVGIGRLQHCDYHGEVFGGGGWALEGDFWPKVMADRKRGVNGPIPWAEELEARDFTDLVKQAYEDHPTDECTRCAKIRDE